MDLEKLIYLLEDFSEGCDRDCESCILDKKDLCGTLYLISRYLKDEITESRMVEEINFDYTLKKINE